MIKKALKQFGLPVSRIPSVDLNTLANRRAIHWISALIGLANLAHFLIANFYVALCSSVLFAFKLILLQKNNTRLPSLFLVMLTLLSLFLVVFLGGGWNTQEAGISILILLLTIKFLESKNIRDYYVVCIVLYFLASCSFLVDSTLMSIIVILIYCLCIVSAQIILTENENQHPIGLSLQLFVKALPIAIVLFVLFPRLQADINLFNTPGQQKTNRLNDALEAGDFASSAFNNTLAFRVEFKGKRPAQSDLYWRVKTLTLENAFNWKRDRKERYRKLNKQVPQTQTSQAPQEYNYLVQHQASQDTFLPYLERIVAPSLGFLKPDNTVARPRKSDNSGFQYNGSSIVSSEYAQALSLQAKKRYLQMSSKPDAQVQELLNQWQKQSKTPLEIVTKILDYFRSQPFHYSLKPPKLAENALTDFLFNTQTGYCEHYASAFTSLARWLNIPARVVVGYQGGEYNESGKFYEVLYSDAHAWSEVWIDGKWIRIDPTATIAPDRIQLGLQGLLNYWDRQQFGTSEVGFRLSDILNPKKWSGGIKGIKNTWDNISYQWTKRVINYDFQQQKAILHSIGIKKHIPIISVTIIMLLISLWLLFSFMRPKKAILSEEVALYHKFVQKLNGMGINKKMAETPLEFAQRASQHLPHLESQIQNITQQYIQIRYNKSNSAHLLAFKQSVQRFKMQRKKPSYEKTRR